MGTIFPRVLGKSPLLTSAVELRFTSSLPGAAVFGLLYSAERERYPTAKQLPAASFPLELAEIDQNLKFQAHYRLEPVDGGPALQIGPHAIVLMADTTARHIDQAFLEGEFLRLMTVFHQLGVVASYDRVGLRYINLFENQRITDRTTVVASIDGSDVSQHLSNLRVELPHEPFKVGLVIANDAQVSVGVPSLMTVQKPNVMKGSLIDIDVFLEPLDISGAGAPEKIVKLSVSAHDAARKLFFTTLKDDLILELDPQD